MKLSPFLIVPAIAWLIAPLAVAGQQGMGMEWGQKARPDPVGRLDMPNVPPQDAPVMIAQANQAQPGDVKAIRTLGVCFPAPNKIYSLENVIEPKGGARAYLRMYERTSVDGPATITVIQQPKHGVLRLVTEADRGTLFSSGSGPLLPNAGLYAYLPAEGYEGRDRATVLVEQGGVKVKVEYFFQAFSGVIGNTGVQDRCGKTGPYWKISSTLDANGNSTISSIEYQFPAIDANASVADTATLGSILRINGVRLD
jgi:hypothetical protein